MEIPVDTKIDICKTEIFEPLDIKQVFLKEEFIKEEDISEESDFCEILENDSENCTPITNGLLPKSGSASTSKNKTPSKQKQQLIKQRQVTQTGYIVRCPKCSFTKEIDIEKKYDDPCPSCNVPIIFQCVKCNLKKEDRRFKNHKCDAKRSFECHLCNYTAIKMTYLRQHRRVHHKDCDNPEDFLKCTRCKKSYKSRKYMIIHEKVCLPKSNWKCSMCDFETHHEKRSRFHMMKHHPEVYNSEKSGEAP